MKPDALVKVLRSNGSVFSRDLSPEQFFLVILRTELIRRVGEEWFQKELALFVPTEQKPEVKPALWFDEIAISLTININGWMECQLLVPVRNTEGELKVEHISFILMTDAPHLFLRITREILFLMTIYSSRFQNKIGTSLTHVEFMFEDIEDEKRPSLIKTKSE